MQCQLWMGNLDANMTESFIMAAFLKVGQRPLSVKMMRNKHTGEPAGYAFVMFPTDDEAIDAMHKLNGKPIPGVFPIVRFRLNTATRDNKVSLQTEREFSVWVGDLSPDVDDYTLYRFFTSRYSSIKTAKVILDNNGQTKGYGFVRFGNEEEQRNALYSMNGYVGLGSRPIKICTAVPKPKGQTNASNNAYGSANDFSQYYDPSTYWQQYSAWGSNATGDGYNTSTQAQAATAPTETTKSATQQTATEKSDAALVNHKKVVDVDHLNNDFVVAENGLWEALEASGWYPNEIDPYYVN